LTQPSVLPWLLGVAVNLPRNQRRAARRRRATLDRLPPLPPQPDPADEVAARVDAERAMRAVRRAVDRLPRREQEVLGLCVWAGLDQRQAAQLLGIAPRTVGSRLSRARTRLRRALDLEGGAQWTTTAPR
jgi:RNA polymerase sigma factor (sigma-70 family)